MSGCTPRAKPDADMAARPSKFAQKKKERFQYVYETRIGDWE